MKIQDLLDDENGYWHLTKTDEFNNVAYFLILENSISFKIKNRLNKSLDSAENYCNQIYASMPKITTGLVLIINLIRKMIK